MKEQVPQDYDIVPTEIAMGALAMGRIAEDERRRYDDEPLPLCQCLACGGVFLDEMSERRCQFCASSAVESDRGMPDSKRVSFEVIENFISRATRRQVLRRHVNRLARRRRRRCSVRRRRSPRRRTRSAKRAGPGSDPEPSRPTASAGGGL